MKRLGIALVASSLVASSLVAMGACSPNSGLDPLGVGGASGTPSTGPGSNSGGGLNPDTGSGGTVGSDTCGNGLDDDGNGAVDEGCPCNPPGSYQSCWSGPASRRGIGACHDGVQTCETYGEVQNSWGPCKGETLPTQEIPANGVDEDCDGQDLNGDPCVPGGEICTGGLDEDCDGYIDCADPDCASACSCPPTEVQCTNGADDDCDGYIDCVDPDCAADPACMNPNGCQPEFPFIVEVACGDGKDNDCDGFIDCDDHPDCNNAAPCLTGMPEICDGIDNDGNGVIDNGNVCKDWPGACPPGAIRACDCYCGVHQKCQSDGTWGPCKVDGSCGVVTETISSCQMQGYEACDFGNCIGGQLAGQCVHHSDCPAGLVCDLGNCIMDNYIPCP